jgi:hypothetical protein
MPKNPLARAMLVAVVSFLAVLALALLFGFALPTIEETVQRHKWIIPVAIVVACLMGAWEFATDTSRRPPAPPAP